MAKYSEAPDGQPTENIRIQLMTAEQELNGARLWRDRCEKQLASADWMLDSRGESVDRLKWQLEQRRKRDGEV